jgi:putative ABC transport system permease protein
MNHLSLAARNLFRNRRRSISTLTAMSIGLTAILVFGGYASSVIYGLQTAVIKRSGHLEIQRRGFFESGGDTPLSYGIPDAQRLIGRIRRDPELARMVILATPILQFGGLAGNDAAEVTRSVLVDGVVPEERNRMFEWNDYEVPNYAEPLALVGKPRDAVVLGAGLAHRLQVCVPSGAGRCPSAPAAAEHPAGKDLPADVVALSELEARQARPVESDRIDLLAATTRGAPNVASLRVVATTNVGVKEWDDVYLVMNLEAAQRLVYGTAPPQVTAVMIQLRHTAQLEAARSRIRTLLRDEYPRADLAVLDYATLNPMYGQSVRFLLSIFTFMAVLIACIVLFTVGNTMSAAVAERTVEVGTLRALGLRRGGVRKLFMCEGLLLGVVGGGVGTATALLVGAAINVSGLTWTPPGHVYAYLIRIRILEDLPLLCFTVVGLVMVAVFSAWWPARRASRMVVVDALRHA